MTREVVVEGNSLEEARRAAAVALGCAPECLLLEVLEESEDRPAGHGWLRVRATLPEESVDGLAGVSGGALVVRDPGPGGRPAVVTPGAHVLLWVNEQPVKESQVVLSTDRVRVEGETREPESAIDVTVAPDGLSCTLSVRRRPKEVYAIEDAPPANRLVIRARLVEQELPPLDAEQVLARLAAAGVTYGIDHEALRQAIERGDGTPVVVARGTPPEPPVHGTVEFLFVDKQRAYEEGTPGERRVFSVEPGEVLAVKTPGRPGRPGKDVHGRELAPPPPREAQLRAGQGTAFREDGLVLVATAVGRPERRGSLVTVVPVYLIPGNADARGGPIKFRGHITVEGDVLDGVVIEAGGNVQVKGLVANSTITAGGGVSIGGNVVGSRIKGGGVALTWEKWDTFWQEAAEMLEELVAAAWQLRRHWESLKGEDQRITDGVLLQACLQGRYRRLPGLVEQSAALLEELGQVIGLDAEHPLVVHLAYLRRCLSGQGCLAIAGLEELEARVRAAKEEAQALKESAQEAVQGAQITASYVQNSVLETTGQVVIGGKGCYNCAIYAGAGVVVDGSPGAFRGGQIISKGHVRVRQLGSEAEARTYVQVPRNFYIKAGEAFPGVLLKAGSKLEKVTARMSVNLLGE